MNEVETYCFLVFEKFNAYVGESSTIGQNDNDVVFTSRLETMCAVPLVAALNRATQAYPF
jgi:hypothetical protein